MTAVPSTARCHRATIGGKVPSGRPLLTMGRKDKSAGQSHGEEGEDERGRKSISTYQKSRLR